MGSDDHGKDACVEENLYDKDDVMEKNAGIPIDCGWAWVISLCVFLNFTLVVGYSRALSVLFGDVAKEFGETATVVSLMFTISHVTAALSTIVTSNVIMVRYSVRRISVIAAILNFLGTMLISQAPNIIVFLILQTIKGWIFGCLMVCPMSLIGYYFKKRLNLALALANTGFCACYIAIPPVTELLRYLRSSPSKSHWTAKLKVEFGLRGCLLLLSAIEFHLVAVNLLLRSPQSYRNIYRSKINSEVQASSHTMPLLSQMDPHPKSEVMSSENFIDCEYEQQNLKKDEKPILENCDLDHSKECMVERTSEEELTTESGQLLHEYDMKPAVAKHDSSLSHDERETERRSCQELHDQEKETNCISGENQSRTKDSASSNLPSTRLRNVKTSIENIVHDVSYSGSHLSLSAPDIALYNVASNLSPSQINADATERPSEKLPQGGAEISAEKECGICSCVGKIFDLTLFKSWLYRMLIVYIPVTSAINLLTIYLPVIAVDTGVPLRVAALYMTISGVLDLIVRVVSGFVADLKCITKTKMVIGSLLVLAVQCHTFSLFINKDTFIIFAIVLGVFGGFRQNLMVSMITDCVGVEKTAKGYAFCTMLTTLFISSNHPIIGAMFDSTGHFILPLHYLGICLFVGLVVLVCEPLFVRLEKKRAEKAATSR